MVSSQILGFTSANTMEVEAATHAARITLRPEDWGSLGIFSLAGFSGVMAATPLAAAARIWSFRWGSTSTIALVKRITFAAANTATAFTAGLFQMNLFRATSFNLSDSVGGTELVPSGNKNKLRTSMGTTNLTSCYIANTGAISGAVAGTNISLDSDPTASLIAGVPATAGSVIIPPTTFFDQRPGEFPFVLTTNEGFIIQSGGAATVPATGTWSFSVRVEWSEVTAYP